MNINELKKIAVLITSHNRREHTLACLDYLYSTRVPKGASLYVILVDDGSTDGTEEEVRARFPLVEIINGNGSFYWNKGMYHAFERAIDIGFDYYMWLNDDTVLYPTAIELMLQTSEEACELDGRPSIVVGSTRDPINNTLTYGGMRTSDRARPFQYTLIEPRNTPIQCDTMNGNCVIIPKDVVDVIGNTDIGFSHAMGDIDYGLRARNADFKILVAPGYVGTCKRNSINGTYHDRSLPLRIRWKKMMHPKGLPPAAWLVLTRRHGGPLWPLYFVWPYIKVLITTRHLRA